MKVKVFPAIISVAISALFAYGLYAWGKDTDMSAMIAIIGGVSLLLTLGTILGLSFEDKRMATNIKTVSAIFAVVSIVAGLVFNSVANISANVIIIVSGIIILLWALLVYWVALAKR